MSLHDWISRVRGLEDRDQMIQREAVREHMAERANDHARRETALSEKALELRELAMEKAIKMMKLPLHEQTRIVEDGPDGEEVTLILKPAKWSLSTACNLYALSQNAAGLTAEEAEISGELDFSLLTEADIQDMLRIDSKIVVRNPREPGREGR